MGKHRHVFLFCIKSVIVTGDGQFVSNIWRNMKWKAVPTATHCSMQHCTVSTETALWTIGTSVHTVQFFLFMQKASASLLLRVYIYINFSSVVCPFPVLPLHFVSWLLLPPDLSFHTSSFSCHIPKPFALTRHRSPLLFLFSSLSSSHILHTRLVLAPLNTSPTFDHVIVLEL